MGTSSELTEKQMSFLDALRQHGHTLDACLASGTRREELYAWMGEAEFSRQCFDLLDAVSSKRCNQSAWGSLFRWHRIKAGLSLEKLTDVLNGKGADRPPLPDRTGGFPLAIVREWDDGRAVPDEETIRVLAAMLNVENEYFLNPMTFAGSLYSVGDPFIHRRIYNVPRGVLLDWANGIPFDKATCPELPPDSIIMEIHDHYPSRTLSITACHPSFDEVPDGCSPTEMASGKVAD